MIPRRAWLVPIGAALVLIYFAIFQRPKPQPAPIRYCLTQTGTFLPCSEVKRVYNI